VATAKDITVHVITLTEEQLRKIIQEEVRKAVEPGAVRPEYLPPVSPYRQQDAWWWQNPIMCGTAPSPTDNRNQIVINDAS
jgi:hypothetical protein